MKKLFLLPLLLLFALPAFASDIYFAQTSAGSNNGTSCSNAYAYNDATHGISKVVNWVAGNTLHICGTISGAAGANLVAAQASGTSGNPITIKFEPGAILQDPVCGTGGSACIYLSGHNFITIDGGNTGNATTAGQWTGGLVQSYANGVSGTNVCPGITNNYTSACTSQASNVTNIEAMGSSNITIKNLGPCVTSVGAVGSGTTASDCIHIQGSNDTITNSQIWYAGTGIDNTQYQTDSNTVISFNDFQQNAWGIGCAGGNNINTNYQIFGNHFHNFTQWNTSGAHINGIHCYDNSGGGIADLHLYNNLFDGPMGSGGWTSWVYLEAGGQTLPPCPGPSSICNWNSIPSITPGTLYAFNNVFVATGTVVNGNGMLNFGSGSNHVVVNNVFYGTGTSGATGTGPCMSFQGSNITVENNVFINCTQILAGPFGGNPGPTFLDFDYNIYSNMSGGGNNTFQVTNASGTNWGTTSFTTWKTNCSCDAHSIAQLGSLLSNFSGEGVPSAGYIGLVAGANLTSIATGALAGLTTSTTAGNTTTGASRPNSAWDIGAYQISGGGGPPPTTPCVKCFVLNLPETRRGND